MTGGKDPYCFGSREAMIKLLQDNGFEVEACWNDYINCPFYTDESVDRVLVGKDFGQIYQSFDKEVQANVREKILNRFRKAKEEFEPTITKIVSIVGKKTS